MTGFDVFLLGFGETLCFCTVYWRLKCKNFSENYSANKLTFILIGLNYSEYELLGLSAMKRRGRLDDQFCSDCTVSYFI